MESKGTIPTIELPDWGKLSLLPPSIGPSDFEKEYLCDVATGVMPKPVDVSASVTSTFRSPETQATIAATTGATTSAHTGVGGMSGSDMLKAIEAMIGSSTVNKILKDTISDSNKVPSEFVARENREKSLPHPDFGSW